MPINFTIPDDETADELLSRPTPGALETLARLEGDVVVLGAGGKMGPTLARMARRGFEQLGKTNRVLAVARFSDAAAETRLRACGIETLRCDLLDREAVARLPRAPHVIFMAGQKFGTSTGPELTWAMNTLTPAIVAEHYAASRIVAFSTGCVYPFTAVEAGGSREDDAPGPPGDYANSCVGRERVFTYFSKRNGTKVLLLRLNYAIDLRYGVLHDIARAVWENRAVDVSTGYVNLIWQGDANAQAIQCLEQTDSPPRALNITGPETLSVRALAHRFGEIFQRDVKISGRENATAWLSNSARAQQLFGPPTVSLDEMLEATAQWIKSGGASLGKPTHFEARDGKF